MKQEHLSGDVEEEKPSPTSSVLHFTGAIGAGLGALYAALARLTLNGVENISDRRAQNRATTLSRRAKAVRAAAAKDNS